jgi:hypothetical protein
MSIEEIEKKYLEKRASATREDHQEANRLRTLMGHVGQNFFSQIRMSG